MALRTIFEKNKTINAIVIEPTKAAIKTAA